MADEQGAIYTPTEADTLADRLLQSIAFKVYSADDDVTRDAAAILRRLATPAADRLTDTGKGLQMARALAIKHALPGQYDGIGTLATNRGDADDKPYMRALIAALATPKPPVDAGAMRAALQEARDIIGRAADIMTYSCGRSSEGQRLERAADLCRCVISSLSDTGEPQPKAVMCGGCGETDSAKRCMGCLHDFGTPDSAWVNSVLSHQENPA